MDDHVENDHRTVLLVIRVRLTARLLELHPVEADILHFYKCAFWCNRECSSRK